MDNDAEGSNTSPDNLLPIRNHTPRLLRQRHFRRAKLGALFSCIFEQHRMKRENNKHYFSVMDRLWTWHRIESIQRDSLVRFDLKDGKGSKSLTNAEQTNDIFFGRRSNWKKKQNERSSGRWNFIVFIFDAEIFLLRIVQREKNSKFLLNLWESNWPVKQPFGDRAFVLRTGLMELRLQGLNRLLFLLSPLVARANIMKFPFSPPGVHCSGSCCTWK